MDAKDILNLIERVIPKRFRLALLCAITASAGTAMITRHLYEPQVRLMREQIAFLEKRLVDLAVPSSGNMKTDLSGLAYPKLQNPESPTWQDVNRLAIFYDLRRVHPTNPHLAFTDGDIVQFHGRGLSERQLRIEFESRRIVLEKAEKLGTKISSQGDLSLLSSPVQEQLNTILTDWR